MKLVSQQIAKQQERQLRFEEKIEQQLQRLEECMIKQGEALMCLDGVVNKEIHARISGEQRVSI